VPRASSSSSILSFIWGTTWLAIKFQLGVVEPEVSVLWRFSLASLVMLVGCRLRGVPLRFGLRDHLSFALLGFLLGEEGGGRSGAGGAATRVRLR
jgi:drug/metabolite transporter (DMT)-like permease